MTLTLASRSARTTAPHATEAADVTRDTTGGCELDPMFEALLLEMVRAPGAAEALLTAFAAQTRALRLVLDADARGAASLPADVRHRLARAIARTPEWLGSA